MSCRCLSSRTSTVISQRARATWTIRRTMATAARQQEKKQIRAQIKQKLSALTEDEVNQQSRKAQDLVSSLSRYQQAKRIGIYLSMPIGEAQTDALVRDALKSGKKVFVPYLHAVGTEKPKRKCMEMLRVNSVEEYEGLEKDSWNIPKLPKEDLQARENAMGGTGLIVKSVEDIDKVEQNVDGESLDVIVVPGVAFDCEMNRMGHGAGFYDNFLTRFFAKTQRAKPFLVGLCLAEQVLPPGQIVMQDWDWKVDAVAVGDGRLLSMEDVQ